MPLLESSALCGPRVFAYALGIPIPEAQEACGWQSSKGTEPEGMVKGLRKYGYKAIFRQNCSLEELVEHLATHKHPLVILDYFDWHLAGADGHYILFYGLDQYGDVRGWNPDFNSEEWTLYRRYLENNWYDYRINPPHEIIRRGAILAHKGK